MAEIEESLMVRMLEDDCIFKILEWLPMSDIRSFSKVCKRLQTLCNDHAQRKLQDETVEIEVSSEGYMGIKWQNENVTFFNNFINRLRIRGTFDISKWHEQDLLASFVKKKCNRNCTYEMVISSGLQMVPFSEEIRNVLNNLEILDVTDETEGRDMSNFLKYCPNLTTLFVSRVHCDEMIDAILRHKYPKLKRVHLLLQCVADTVPTGLQSGQEVLKTFLLNNDQIQYLELSDLNDIWFYGNENGRAELRCIEIVVDFAQNLEHFFLQIDEHLQRHFDQVYIYLKNLCDRSNFKSLGLGVAVKLLMRNSTRLTNFKQLKKLYIESGFEVIEEIGGDFRSLFGPFVQLKSLVIDLTPLYYGNNDRIMLPPQIEELTLLDKGGRIGEDTILSYSMFYISRCENLKKLSVFQEPRMKRFLTFPVAEMKKAREKLNRAASITIFTNFDGNKTNSDHKLVKLRFVSIYGLRFNASNGSD